MRQQDGSRIPAFRRSPVRISVGTPIITRSRDFTRPSRQWTSTSNDNSSCQIPQSLSSYLFLTWHDLTDVVNRVKINKQTNNNCRCELDRNCAYYLDYLFSSLHHFSSLLFPSCLPSFFHSTPLPLLIFLFPILTVNNLRFTFYEFVSGLSPSTPFASFFLFPPLCPFTFVSISSYALNLPHSPSFNIRIPSIHTSFL